MNKQDNFYIVKEDMTYNELVDVFNNSGEPYEGTHSLYNFVGAYYPQYFEAVEYIVESDWDDPKIKAAIDRPLRELMAGRYDFVKVEPEISIEPKEIDLIMQIAKERGVGYWCRKVELVGKDIGLAKEYMLSRGYTLKLHDRENGDIYELTKEKLLRGISLWVKNPIGGDFESLRRGDIKFNLSRPSGLMCDAIIQFAIFGEIRRTLPNRGYVIETLKFKYDDEES